MATLLAISVAAPPSFVGRAEVATFERREVTTRRVEFHVPTHEPWGACWAEVDKAMDAALTELREKGELAEYDIPSDDRIRIHGTDEAIVVAYDIREAEPASTTGPTPLGQRLIEAARKAMRTPGNAWPVSADAVARAPGRAVVAVLRELADSYYPAEAETNATPPEALELYALADLIENGSA